MNNQHPSSHNGQRLLSRLIFLVFLISLCGVVGTSTLDAGEIISREDAARLGLHRAWITQVELDPARSRVANIEIQDGQLFALTDAGTVQAIDAETGATAWAAQFGNPNYPSLGPAANSENVAFVNGSQLFLIERATGRKIWQRQTDGAPAAGPQMSDDRVYVPLVQGTIESFEIDNPQRSSWHYHSEGQPLSPPIVTDNVVCWTTDRGYLYGGELASPAVNFRLKTRDAIVSSPVYRPPNYYCASLDGEVYAVDGRSGKLAWRTPTGHAIEQSPVVINDRVYVCPNHAGLLCLSVETGEKLWSARGVSRFVAASPQRIYASDRLNRIHVLDGKTGHSIGILPTATLPVQITNHNTDRIYLGTTKGLLQCLHEIDLTEPVHYGPQQGEDEELAPDAAAQPADALPADAGPEPDAVPDDAGDDAGDDPFNPED